MTSRIPALDGLRGLAILLVLFGHLRIRAIETSAAVGVTLFFVLSGFLITGILTRQSDNGGVRFGEFYKRRARRLLPALLLMLAVAAILRPVGWWERTWPAVFYVGNWPLMSNQEDVMGNIAHVWSLAVEEHFYLIWPLVITAVPKAWRVKGIGTLALGFAVWRIGVTDLGWKRLYYGTDTNAYAILAGAYLSVARLPKFHPAVGLAAVLGLIWIGIRPFSGIWLGLTFVTVLLAAVAVLVASDSIAILETPWLRWFGTISYGLYLWHVPIFEQFEEHRLWVWPFAVFVAWLSWIWVERPILDRPGHRLVPAPL